MKTQIIIPVATSNIDILKKNIKYIKKYVLPDSIYILTSERNFVKFKKLPEGVFLIDEDKVIPGWTFEKLKDYISKTSISVNKTGWYYQQFLKLYWSQSEYCSDYFTSWDADTIPLHRINLFSESGEPYIHFKDEFHQPYFDTINRLFKFNKKVCYSFISEKMTFSKNIVCSMFKDINFSETNGNDIVEKIINIASESEDERAFSEFETYGTYVNERFYDIYKFQNILSLRSGCRLAGKKPNIFNLTLYKLRYDTVSFETWDNPLRLKSVIFNLYAIITFPLNLISNFMLK